MNNIAVSLIYRNETIAHEVFAATPRTGEFVRLADGRKFRVDEVEWNFASGAVVTLSSSSVRVSVTQICAFCYIPVSRETAEMALCSKCEELEV